MILNSCNKSSKEIKKINSLKNDIEPTSTDYIKKKNIVNESVKKNKNINSHILSTNGWNYNEWILPEKYNNNCFNFKEKSLPYWDSFGISMTKEEKYHNTVPNKLPNLGDGAVVKNENDWLFNSDRGLLNNSPI